MRVRRSWHRLGLKPETSTSCLTTPDTAPVLHVFRALLRECTYLPDPSARHFCHQYVVARFHANRTPLPHQSTSLSKRAQAVLNRRSQLLKKSHKVLKTLCRANYGHFQPLSKILALTYGRIGPRRHELIQRLTTSYHPLADDTRQLAKQLENLHLVIQSEDPALTAKPRDVKKWRADLANQHVPLPTSQLNALLKSQISRRDGLLPRKPLKKITPKIPETNIWGRPTPIKRVRNIKRKWYADVLGRVMPPLPESEWELLRKKAFGEIYLYRPIRRRGLSDENNIGQETYSSDDQMKRPHTISSRFMRRLWATVFQQCPLIKQDPTKPFGWDVIWSDVKAGTGIRLDSMIAGYQDFFHGVDENGKLRASKYR